MNEPTKSIQFRKNSSQAVLNEPLRKALALTTDLFVTKRVQAVAELPAEEWRDRASEIRTRVLDDLPAFIDTFSANARKAGAVVHSCKDSASAVQTIAGLLKDRCAKRVVKAKSMITEEIHLNEHLEREGIEVVETDLGEYIIQLAGERPSHILAPAIHRSRYDVGRLFTDKLGVEYSHDPEVLIKIARKELRNKFLAADAGISGANFAVADTGSLVLFTNEGNGRMVTTVPKFHIAVFSIEKIIPSIRDLPLFMRMLPRFASGQTISSYVSLVTGARKPGENTGPEELHIILLDNGRSEIALGPYREILKCIRCSACLNVCPVYRVAGGHAYDSTYPGPMGIVLTSLLKGMHHSHELLDATTLCGACSEACPVRVPIVKLLRDLKKNRVEAKLTPPVERLGMSVFGSAIKSSKSFSLAQKLCRFLASTAQLFLGRETAARIPKPVKKTFKAGIHKPMPCDKKVSI